MRRGHEKCHNVLLVLLLLLLSRRGKKRTWLWCWSEKIYTRKRQCAVGAVAFGAVEQTSVAHVSQWYHACKLVIIRKCINALYVRSLLLLSRGGKNTYVLLMLRESNMSTLWRRGAKKYAFDAEQKKINMFLMLREKTNVLWMLWRKKIKQENYINVLLVLLFLFL